MGNGHHGGQGLQVKEGGGEHPEETSTATPAKNGAKSMSENREIMQTL